MHSLSFGQQRLWFLDQLDGPSATYNVPFPLRLTGRLDRSALRAALADLLDRHEVLRTVIPVREGVPEQRVLTAAEAADRLPFELVELTEDAVPAALADAAGRPFDLATELPVRVTLYRVGAEQHVLLVLLHHIACDGWSLGPLARDLGAAYTARLAGAAPDWEPLPVQYLDFAEWQREVLGTEDDPDSLMSAQLDYWTRRLAGLPERLSLPGYQLDQDCAADSASAASAQRHAGLVELTLPAELHARLVEAGRAAHCTPFMVLQAGVAALLNRCGAGTDIVLGTPVTGRNEEALSDLIGFFVNTLVLRTDLTGDPGFGELLGRVRADSLTAYTHQDVPFDRLVDRLVVDRDSAAHPLFQVMIVLQHDAGGELELPGLDVQPVALDIATAKLDLSVVFSERYDDGRPAGIGCQLEYATDLFEHATVVAMGELLARVLGAGLAEPQRPLSQLPAGRPAASAEPAPVVEPVASPVVDPAAPTAEPAPADEPRASRAPRDARERILCDLFADVLGRDSVGLDDGFFALGGHSLLATQLISRIRTTLRVELGVRELFRAPTVAGILATVDRRGAARLRPALRRYPRPEPLPLSSAQQRLWFLSGLPGQDRAYNIPLTLRLTGPVDRAALAAACRDVVGRHEALRTVFPAVDGQPYQRILDRTAVGEVLTVVECAESELTALAGAAGSAPFDLAAELPLRATLFCAGKTESVLVLCLHHIAADGESLAPLLGDLALAYAARVAGRQPAWAELPVQYADYTLWQRELLGDEADPQSALSEQLAFWRQALAGLPPELALPTDHTRPAIPSHRKESAHAEVDADTHAALLRLARSAQVTLFMVVQAALAVVLARSGAGEDVPIGTPVAGRSDEALDELVGFFVNTLVLRTDVSGAPSFRQLLDRVREADLAAFAHQDVPFERLVEELNPVRAGGRHPLFQVLLSFLAAGGDEAGWQLPGLTVTAEDTSSGTAKFDLSVTVAERAAGLGCTLDYAADLFDPSTAQALVERLVTVLAAVAADPEQRVDQLPILSPVERGLVVSGFNATGVSVGGVSLPGGSLSGLLGGRVSVSPDVVAVVAGGRSWSYAEFGGWVEGVARGLVASGVVPGDVVAVSLPRSVELVAAVFAVQAAGAGYVPVDPGYPGERVAFMLADAKPRFVIDRESLAELMVLGAQEVALPEVSAAAGAYVIYTSGSTGRPKGVLMSHAGIVNHLAWMQDRYPLAPGDRVLLKTPSSFDVSVLEFFRPMLAGAGLVVAPADAHRDPACLAETIQAEGVSVLYVVPGILEALLEQPDVTGRCGSLRQVFCGGEVLTAALAARCAEVLPGVELVNLYGPTEVAVDATAHRVTGEYQAAVPIGGPVWNTQALVLDARLQPVPVGVAGELYLGGAQLADGYLHRPGLTAERFLANPFGGPGERMYRTGDVVRWTRTGELDYLGRADDQVKLRGQRIELGEIEAVAARHASVAQARVLIREDQPGEQHLILYATRTQEADPDGLRAHLAAQLPAYMLPAATVWLDTFPLLPNGKIDRTALPAPDFTGNTDTYRAPRTPAEDILCGLFADLLGLDHLGIDDNFFDLGGHSLLATRLTSRIRTAFGVELGITELFDAPTVAGLAARLDRAEAARPALRATARPELLPLSYAQQRLWFLMEFGDDTGTYDMSYALRLKGELDRDALRDALADLTARHEVLRTVFGQVDGQPYQQILAEWRPELPVVPCSEAELPAALVAATAHRFDLATEPPLRAVLLAVDPETHVLVVVLHHVACDGWSMGPLSGDVAQAYEARTTGQHPGWAELPVQYADYALWQRQLLGEEDDPDSLISRQLGHWRHALAGAPQELALPTDRPRPLTASGRGDSVEVSIDAATHTALLELARSAQVTLFMLIQAALAVVLARCGAGEDIPIGTAVAGRSDEALDELVGFFVNTLVLRTDVSGAPSFRQLLDRVRETDLAAFAHQDLPFERLVHELNPTRTLARHPLFQVMLVLQNTADSDLTLPGLRVTPEVIDGDAVKFDLGLTLTETHDENGAAAGLAGSLSFAADLFDRATAQGLAERLLLALTGAIAEPDRPISTLDLLSPVERGLVVSGFNATGVSVGGVSLPGGSLSGLLGGRVSVSPDVVAVVAGGRSWSYAEFGGWVEGVARGLVASGVVPGDVVAVSLPRSVELVAAVFAVQAAGAGYVPVDPGYPGERVAFMLADAKPRFVIDRESLAELMVLGAQEVALPEVSAAAGAYVIYTSGSTGRPKGVLMSHAGIVNHLAWMQDRYPLAPGDRVLLKTPSSFDVSVLEFFRPMLAGAGLVVAPADAHRDPACLAETIQAEGVSVLYVVPGILEALLEQPDVTGRCGSLRQVFCGGEVLTAALAARCAEVLPGVELVNLYGPTEVAVDATAHRVTGEYQAAVPIGGPVWNTQALVLDARLQPVPVGVAGELYLGGAQLADGYLHRPGLTAERFLANPFGGPGERMYRTGDVVRWTRTGELDYLGRADDQVKLRGQRIELGEIEAVAARHASVAQARVLIREDQPGEQHLILYATRTQEADPDGLRAHLAAQLPAYMLPAATVWLDTFPLLPNGKIDRTALPAPDFTGNTDTYRAPRTPAEDILCGLFADLLGLDHLGIDDNFFDLGGHSLLATRLTSRIRTALQAEVSIRDLFSRPTVAGLAALVDGRRGEVRPALAPAGAAPEIPLSFAQQRLWFLNRMDGAAGGYAVTTALRLAGDLDQDALAAALTDVADRHQVLRTVLPERNGQPYQQILGADATRLQVREVAEDQLAAAMDEVSAVPFDLTVDVPFRPYLFALAERTHVLVVVLHHVACDGWSMGPLLGDVARAYEARTTGQHPGWAELPVQYADYALWQRELLGEEGDPDSLISRQLGHWRHALAGAPQELALPTDRPRPLTASGRGDSVEVTIDAATHTALLELARTAQVTLFMLIQAALAVVLARCGAGEDIPIGTAVAGRSDEALDELVGFFVNTLVLRTDVSGAPSFRQLLDRVRETDLAAFAHQDLPFERLVHELNPTRTLARHPLFQVMLVLQNAADSDLTLPGLQVTGEPVGTHTIGFDLALSLHELPDGIGGGLSYRTDIFDRSTARALVARFVRLLAAAVAEPDRPISTLEVLSDAERAALAPRPEPAGRYPLVTELLAGWADRTPDAPALAGPAGRLTFAELDAAANRLAWHLIESGAGRGALVGICLPRGPEQVVAQLAVLRSGGAYVPLDPAYPADRLAFMLADSGATVVLTRTELTGLVGGGTSRVVCLDQAAGALAGCPAAAPPVPVSAADAAYLIYTSGSTGLPKGVLVEHGGLASLCAWHRERYQVGPADRASQVAALSFDASVLEVWPLLAAGASVHQPPEDALADTGRLAEWLAEQRISVAFLPTPRLEAMLDEPALAGSTLRLVLTGGDRLRRRPAAGLPFRLVNAYGPTEYSVVATSGEVDPARSGELPDLGTTVPAARGYLLDRYLNPVPDGVAGELYLSGPGLARGYLGRPGLTGDRFLPDPFAGNGARMYRTGDLMRRRAGRLEFLGRADDQVKVRGVRIELGEVDAVLAGCPGVRQAATMLREDRPGHPELVGYLVLEPATSPDDVRRHCAAALPEHTVPSAFVVLPELPLTSNGKLDKAALPAPVRSTTTGGRAPRNEREALLCELFAELLGLESVGIDEGFFDLGGHSMLAARLSSRLRQELGAELGLRALFETPTVAGLAERLSGRPATGDEPDELAVLLPLRATGDRAPLFCVHPAVGVSWAYAGLLGRLPGDRPVYALQSRGLAEPDRQPADFTELIEDYLAQLRSVQPAGPYHLLGWSFGGQVAQALAARLAEDGEQVGLLAILDGYPPATHRPASADEGELLAELLVSLGHDLSDAGPLDQAGFAARLRDAGGPLGALTGAAVSALPAVFRHNVTLAGSYQPPVYAGDVLFVQATGGRGDGSPRPADWAPYLTGTMTVLSVPVRHGELARPEPLARIGAAVADRLAGQP